MHTVLCVPLVSVTWKIHVFSYNIVMIKNLLIHKFLFLQIIFRFSVPLKQGIGRL